MTKVLLIRHGETVWNLEGRIQGSLDSPLTALGRAQAEALGAQLAREALDALHASDLGRTRQTTDPISSATGLAAVFDSAWRERNYGDWEGRVYAEIKRDFPEEYERILHRDEHAAAPNGESAAQFQKRIVAALTRLARAKNGRRIAVVTHGGVLGTMYRYVNGLTLDAPRNYTIANASINRLHFDGSAWSVESWGEVAHLGAQGADIPH
ncbi:MAG: histidine phosphatase family protein [Betaproteobacteria bacterium]|nr:histidine phosphatase family protein [Betaproteobacteria bacterium]MBI2959405.1 histidine phosphatase family protein [Betaproteobacteria bacterium]